MTARWDGDNRQMKADYTEVRTRSCGQGDGDNRQMKADYTNRRAKRGTGADGDNRQMKADYTGCPFNISRSRMEITAK